MPSDLRVCVAGHHFFKATTPHNRLVIDKTAKNRLASSTRNRHTQPYAAQTLAAAVWAVSSLASAPPTPALGVTLVTHAFDCLYTST